MSRRKRAGQSIIDALVRFVAAALIVALGSLLIYYIVNAAMAEMVRNVVP